MKFISKFKDYYDYLQGIYGIDEKLIFDRRFKEKIIRPTSHNGKEDPKQYAFCICNKRYVILQHADRFYYTLEEIKELAAILKKEGKILHTNPWRLSQTLDYEITKQGRYTKYLEETLNENKWKEMNGLCAANSALRHPVLIRDTVKNIWKPNVLLEDYGFAARIPAEKMYQDISSFMSWMIDYPPIENNQTNKNKILSHGFDFKRSFRPKMKSLF